MIGLSTKCELLHKKDRFIKNIKIITIISSIAVIVHSCAPFSELTVTINDSRNIEGIYLNKNPADSSWKSRTLWSLIDHKSEVKRDSLYVKIDIDEDNTLRAYLISKDSVYVEKKIKGKFKEDGCYYSRRKFYIIPILPILWGYSNYQRRLYIIDEELRFEVTSNSGGVVIFMAGGDKYNDTYKFTKVE